MRERHIFTVGDTFEVGGLSFRIVQGRKQVDDQRLDVLTQEGWRAVPMELGAFLADFFAQNEDRLYPNQKGGRYYLEFIARAKKHGWRFATDILETERRLKNIQPALFTDGEAA